MITWLKNLWDAMWPNMFAPSAITLAAIGISHWRQKLHTSAHWQAVRAQVRSGLEDVDGKLDRHHLETHRRLDDQAQELATIKGTPPPKRGERP